jgi:surfactin family lipopeptide synthetase A
MDNLKDRLALLSPEKRAWLEAKLQKRKGLPAIPSLLRRESQGSVPLSFSQQRLWFLEQMEGELTAYNIPSALRLKGSLEVEALRRAMEEMVQRHETLRTTFSEVEGEPVQIIRPMDHFGLPVEDLSSLDAKQQEIEIAQRCRKEAEKPFDLTVDLMLRACLLQLSEDEHVLLLTIHHIASDGWSLRILWRDLGALYKAYRGGTEPNLPDLPVQYADFAVWQRSQLDGPRLEQLLQYWREQLESLSVLELPTDHVRPVLPTYCGAYHHFELPEALVTQLQSLSQTSGVTLHMTLLAAFQILLFRYSGQYDIAVGVPVAGRERTELDELIGFFVNTLVLRTDLSGDPTFPELLNRVRQVSLDAYDHQDLPFEKLVEELSPERQINRSPLVQVLFQLLSFRNGKLELSQLQVSRLPPSSQRVRFDLEMHVWQREKTLSGSIVYSTDLFDLSTIERMVGHFITLLEGIVATPGQRISQLPLLTEPERHQLLVEWNNTQTDYPNNTCIHQLFEEQVDRTPDAVAIVFEDEQLTYRELNCRANQLAHYLQKLGVKPDVLVGICLERSLEPIVGLLGILKAGGAYIPLDPDYPQDRLALMVEDSHLSILITKQPAINIIPNYSGTNINLDSDWSKIALESTENLNSNVTAQNLAYIIYTSGSTGKPKGVQLAHQGVVNFLTSMAREPGITSDDILFAVTSISFDIAVLELFLPLTVGAKVIIASQSERINGIKLLKLITKEQVTMMQATPATWKMLQAGKWDKIKPIKILCGGEAMSEELAAWMLQHCSSLWNVYGPTEATVWATVHQVQPDDKPIPIGHPLANTQIQILDRYGQLVPIGVPGEIHIGGVQLARGYINRPELTEEKFIPNPFNNSQGDRLYKTGDLARYLPDGNIEFFGRIDNQVKIRGFRIELGEVEATLSQHPSVAQTVVIDREDTPGDKRLVAYVVPKDLSSIQNPKLVLSAAEVSKIQNQLRDFLKQKLPDYMIPSAFVLLENLPLTPNGKIDRRALPVPDQTRLEPEETFIAPRDELEIQLTKIWEQVLGIQPIGVRDNFFDLGGHSLLAVRLFAAIEKELGRKLPLSALFLAPTVEQFANVLRQEEYSYPDDSLVPMPWNSLVMIKAGGDKQPLFLVHDADGEIILYLSLAHHLDSERPVYGLQPYGREGYPILHTRITDLATYYIEKIRSVQPKGPYLVGGLCAGGVLAFEIACQLQAQGEEIALVALLDAADVQARRKKGRIAHQRLNKLSQVLNQSQQLKGGRKLFYLLKTVLKKVTKTLVYETNSRFIKLQNKFKVKLYVHYLENKLPIPKLLQSIRVRTIFGFAFQEYTPQIYQGQVVLFRATETVIVDEPSIDDTPVIEIMNDPLFGWEKRVKGKVEVEDIPGGHSSCLREPYVQVLADKMESYIKATLKEESNLEAVVAEKKQPCGPH